MKLKFRGFYISILDDPLVSNVVFYPRKTKVPKNLPIHIKVLQFQISEEILIGGLSFIKDKNLPTMLLFHGNGEIAEDYVNLHEIFFDCDLNLAVVDYRGYGFSSGKPFYSSLFTDALPVFDHFKDWMKKQKLKDSLFVMGRSLGSVCASEIGANRSNDLRGIFFESGFASIYNLMTNLFGIKNISPEMLESWSNDIRIVKIQKPVLIIHGTNDQIIPFSEGELIYKSLPQDTEKKFVPIKGAGHNNLLSYIHEYLPPLREFTKKYGS